ncbi:MAG: 50S ribosomal protein L21 [Bacillota bacterium]
MRKEDYAVIETGGKQYRVSPGDTIRVEKLDRGPDERVEFDRVLLVRSEGELTVGRPVIDGARVVADVVSEGKGDKVTVFKYKPKVNYRKLRGHRQQFSEVRIDSIDLPETG